MPLPAMIREALLGRTNDAREVLDLVVAHERGGWDEAGRLSGRLPLQGRALSVSYADALRWARELSKQGAA
jgi:c-di-GMP-related signal transduction protein